MSSTMLDRLRRPAIIAAITTALFAFPLGVLASHQFGDVPNSHTFHADIAAIADAGVTGGCGGGDYCPNRYVTRAEMAAFMNRLGALGPTKSPVVNADRVDGLDANELTRVAYEPLTGQTAIPIGGEIAYGEITIVAPAAGFVLVTTNATVQNATCTTYCIVGGRLRHVQANTESGHMIASPRSTDNSPYAIVSSTAVFPVSAGANTFEVVLDRNPNGNGVINSYRGQVTALFSPYGPTGGATLGTDGTP